MRISCLLILLTVVVVLPALADDVDRWIQDLKDPNPNVRIAAVEALGKLNDIRAVDPLIIALKDEEWRVRSEASEALGKLNDTRAVDPLIQALNDSDIDVREYAAEALKGLGQPVTQTA